MRIVQVNGLFDLQGSTEAYVHELIRRQRSAGHELHVFSTQGEKNLPSADSEFFVPRPTSRTDRFWYREASESMKTLIERVRPDVVHLHQTHPFLTSSILGPIRQHLVPCVQTLHDYHLACPSGEMFARGSPCERCKGGQYQQTMKQHCAGATWLPNALLALQMASEKTGQVYEKTSRLFLCPSRFMKEKMEDWGQPPSKLRHVPKPVDVPSQSASRNGGYLLFVGTLAREKGLDAFIEAAAMVPELPVKIVGRGPDDERFQSLAKTKGAHHISFLGLLGPEELAQVRDRAAAFVLPSLRYENAPAALLEAMASGLPCLVSRIGSMPELIENDVNGFLATAGDAQDWLRALRRFRALTDEAKHDMGVRNRQAMLKQHTWDSHLAQLAGCYAEAGA